MGTKSNTATGCAVAVLLGGRGKLISAHFFLAMAAQW